jgi:hypothetical protein
MARRGKDLSGGCLATFLVFMSAWVIHFLIQWSRSDGGGNPFMTAYYRISFVLFPAIVIVLVVVFYFRRDSEPE